MLYLCVTKRGKGLQPPRVGSLTYLRNSQPATVRHLRGVGSTPTAGTIHTGERVAPIEQPKEKSD